MFKKLTFSGGIHPPHSKKQTESLEIVDFPAPMTVIIPMSMHIGAPAKVLVKKGDVVKAGQIIGEAGGFVSSPVHASVAGCVASVGTFAHPSGKKITAVEIENDDSYETTHLPPITNWHEVAAKELIKRVADCGIVGKGGASFPAHVKLSPPAEEKIDTLIINAAECEPYLTADHRMMLEMAEEVLTGVAILQRILNTERTVIGIEKNKPDAIKKLSSLVKRNKEFSFIEIAKLETKYPQGGEKQLITAITGRRVPSGGLPMKAGCVVQNVGTAKSVYEGVVLGIPLYKRVMTITGPTVKKPMNLMVPVGTQIKDILAFCETDMESTKKVIMGGPMMGMTQSDLDAPVVKSTSGILCISDLTPATQEYNCINCGACVEACPINLVPSQFGKMVRKDIFDSLEEHNLFDCIECGSCSFVCPSKINLVHYIKLGKNRVMATKKK